jgi:hypothetical protein
MGINKPGEREIRKCLESVLAGDFMIIVASCPQVAIFPFGGRRN